MKLALFSDEISPDHIDRLKKLLDKDRAQSRGLFLSTAAVPYKDVDLDWLLKYKQVLMSLCAEIDELSILTNIDIAPYGDLSQYDVIFVSGGNTFYLTDQLHTSGFDIPLKQFITGGKGLYSGSSAGTVILMDNITPIGLADDASIVPEGQTGLSILPFNIIPHMDNKKYASTMQSIYEQYTSEKKEVITLNDNEALFVDGDTKTKI